MALLSKSEIIAALTRLGELASAEGFTVELILFGGGVMVLDLDARPSTQDLDAIIVFPVDSTIVRRLTAIVASELGWPQDWLNDAVKGFVVGIRGVTLLYEAPGIRVGRPTYAKLLAMKLCAWRDDVDIADARRLLSEVPGSRDVVWELIRPHIQQGRELVAQYAFNDLWEEANRGD